MTAYTQPPAERAHALRHLNETVRRIEYPAVSGQGKRLAEALVIAAGLIRSYEASGGTGWTSYVATLDRMHHQLRQRRKAFVRHALRHGGDAREAYAWARVLCRPFAAAFKAPIVQALRWLQRTENRHTRRMRREERAA
jgi:hypothetical protein